MWSATYPIAGQVTGMRISCRQINASPVPGPPRLLVSSLPFLFFSSIPSVLNQETHRRRITVAL